MTRRSAITTRSNQRSATGGATGRDSAAAIESGSTNSHLARPAAAGTDGTQGTGGITPAEALGHLVGVRAVVLQQHRVARVDERSEERFAQRAQRDPPAAQPHRQASTQANKEQKIGGAGACAACGRRATGARAASGRNGTADLSMAKRIVNIGVRYLKIAAANE